MTEQEALVALNAVPGLGSIRIRKLLEHFGSAQKIFSLSQKDFRETTYIPANVVEKIFHFNRDKHLKNEYNLLNKYNIQLVTYSDDCYPANLKEIPDAPIVLYIKGKIQKSSGLAVAVVGSRRASLYGLSVAEKFAASLAEMGITIVSGLARGIDTAAHRGCLKAQGTTLAVLGCGLAHVYPPENKALLEKIAENGAVISEFPIETLPIAHNFPRRNRIVSGLSSGVVVVEASARSGALITSRLALEQGREVFAVPGKVDQPNAQGVNQLIQQGAKLVCRVEDILEELKVPIQQWLAEHQQDTSADPSTAIDQNLSDQEQEMVNCISQEPVSLDELVIKTRHSISNSINVLLQLELKQVIKQLPGKFFVRKN